MLRIRQAGVAALVAVVTVLGFAGAASAVEVTYDPAAPQGAVTSLITSNWAPFAAMAIAIATVGIPLVLGFSGIQGVWNTLRGLGSRVSKGRGK